MWQKRDRTQDTEEPRDQEAYCSYLLRIHMSSLLISANHFSCDSGWFNELWGSSILIWSVFPRNALPASVLWSYCCIKYLYSFVKSFYSTNLILFHHNLGAINYLLFVEDFSLWSNTSLFLSMFNMNLNVYSPVFKYRIICRCCCSVAKSCLSLYNPMDCSMPISSVLHYLPKFAQIHVHWVSDAI